MFLHSFNRKPHLSHTINFSSNHSPHQSRQEVDPPDSCGVCTSSPRGPLPPDKHVARCPTGTPPLSSRTNASRIVSTHKALQSVPRRPNCSQISPRAVNLHRFLPLNKHKRKLRLKCSDRQYEGRRRRRACSPRVHY